MIKSPLKYPGAKGRAIPQIAPLIPEFKEYREPFIGGGSVFLYVKQTYGNGNNKSYWINDLYYPLYNFWRQSQSNVDVMIDNILKWKNQSRNGHQLQQFLKINKYKFNDVELGAMYWALNRVSFSGLPRGCSEHDFDTMTKQRIMSLKQFSDILSNTSITNLDYSKLVEADGDNVFIFLDPPYFGLKWPELYGCAERKYNLHQKFDHYKFAEVMKKCKHKFLITYDDSNTIRRLFDWANIIEFRLRYSLSNKKKYSQEIGNEIFISNCELPKDEQLSIDDAWL